MKLLPWDYGVRNLLRAPGRTALGAGGVALVTALLVTAAAFVRGMNGSLAETGGLRNVILLGAGSEDSVERSEVKAGVAGIVAASVPGIEERLGVPYVSPEINVALVVNVDGQERQASFRGVTDAAYLVHPQVRIVEGRAPRAGELLVGRFAAARLDVPDERLAVGRSVDIDGRPWTIAGRFEAPGTVLDAEIWCDAQELRVATRRETLSGIVLTLADDAQTDDLDLFTKQRLDLELVALPERGYYARLHDFLAPVRAMVWTTALLVAGAALLGGIDTMHASFAARIRELATLRALGFANGAIALSLVQEALLTAALGALVGAACVLPLDGLAVRVSMGAFGLRVDGTALALGLGAACGVGLLGSLPAAWRCLRMELVAALRAD